MTTSQSLFRLPPDTKQYLKQYSDEHGLSLNAGLIQILSEHQSMQVGETAQLIAKELLPQLDEHYKNTFTRIRLASNGADKNVQVLLEAINTLLVGLKLNHLFYSTRLVKSDTMKEAEREVTERIAHFKEVKDNRNTGKISE